MSIKKAFWSFLKLLTEIREQGNRDSQCGRKNFTCKHVKRSKCALVCRDFPTRHLIYFHFRPKMNISWSCGQFYEFPILTVLIFIVKSREQVPKKWLNSFGICLIELWVSWFISNSSHSCFKTSNAFLLSPSIRSFLDCSTLWPFLGLLVILTGLCHCLMETESSRGKECGASPWFF